MPFSHLPPLCPPASATLVGLLDRRSAPRLFRLLCGALFARGRRTVTSWFRAAGITTDFRPAYHALRAAGRRASSIAHRLLGCALLPLIRQTPGDHLLFGIDDTPTARYGPCVQGAGIHHNPSPGPAGENFVYGHIWVTLAWLVRHPAWHTLSLPLRALLYVRTKDVPQLVQAHPWEFAHQAGTGRRIGPLADQLAGADGQGPVAGGRWRLRQAALLAADPGVGLGGVQSAAQGCPSAELARDAASAGTTRAVADLRPQENRPGQACRSEAWLAVGRVRAVRRAG